MLPQTGKHDKIMSYFFLYGYAVLNNFQALIYDMSTNVSEDDGFPYMCYSSEKNFDCATNQNVQL